MKTLSLLLIASMMAACSHYPTPLPNGRGGVAYVTQVGGKWMHTINADGSQAFTGDNEISLQHVAQMITTLGLGYFEYLRQKITELTAQLANTNLTSVQRLQIKSDLARFQAELAAAERLKSQGIGAGATLGPVNFQ